MANLIEFSNIVQEFDNNIVLKGVNLQIEENEFVTLLGPSGCGKTTLLRILGGFLAPTQGKVIFDGKDITDVPAYKREINTVFQKYALFPHLNVYDNIAFGLKIKKEPKDIIAQKVNRMLKLVGLEEYGKRAVTEMSGGQQQRVAIARALVNEPKVLLLDEPLGALDLKLRKEMQKELKKIQQEVGITFIFVTHDQEEALTMSDKIVVMKDGVIQQIGNPTQIYNEPANRYVANFIGESNIIEGVMKDDRLVVMNGKPYECVDYGFEKNENVKIVENKDAKASLYIAATNKIVIADVKNSYTRIQTIAHECLHSIQNRKIQLFNFIFSNIYLLYFLTVLILALLNKLSNAILFLGLMVLLSYIYYFIRSYLENDAMIKAKFLAKEIMEDLKISSEDEIQDIVKSYDKINDIGIKMVNFELFLGTIIKTIILAIAFLI